MCIRDRPSSVRQRGTDSSGAADDRSVLAGVDMTSISWRYDGVPVAITLCVSAAVLYVMRCLTGSQCNDRNNGAASVRPPRWQTTQAIGYSEPSVACRWSPLEHHKEERCSSRGGMQRYCKRLSAPPRRTADRARDEGRGLLLGWVTVCWQVNHLGI